MVSKMNENMVGVWENYGPLQVDCLYEVIKYGKDYYVLKCRGKSVYTPKNIVNFHPKPPQSHKIESEEEDFINYLDDYYMDGV